MEKEQIKNFNLFASVKTNKIFPKLSVSLRDSGHPSDSSCVSSCVLGGGGCRHPGPGAKIRSEVHRNQLLQLLPILWALVPLNKEILFQRKMRISSVTWIIRESTCMRPNQNHAAGHR